MDDPVLYPRFVADRLLEALDDTPVVLIHGPRQCGKTTLARRVGGAERLRLLQLRRRRRPRGAERRPGRLRRGPAGADDPRRGAAGARAVHRPQDRRGSDGALRGGSCSPARPTCCWCPQLADSLAGRMEILRLHPLAQASWPGVAGLPRRAVRRGLQGARAGATRRRSSPSASSPAATRRRSREPHRRRRAPGTATTSRPSCSATCATWPASARSTPCPRLLALAAAQTARLLNVSDLAAPFQLSRPTIRDYVTLLERVFLLETLPPWHSNRLSRLVKTPKLHLGDTGLACALLGVDAPLWPRTGPRCGQLLETFVYQELRRQASWARGRRSRSTTSATRTAPRWTSCSSAAAASWPASRSRPRRRSSTADFRGLRKLGRRRRSASRRRRALRRRDHRQLRRPPVRGARAEALGGVGEIRLERASASRNSDRGSVQGQRQRQRAGTAASPVYGVGDRARDGVAQGGGAWSPPGLSRGEGGLAGNLGGVEGRFATGLRPATTCDCWPRRGPSIVGLPRWRSIGPTRSGR